MQMQQYMDGENPAQLKATGGSLTAPVNLAFAFPPQKLLPLQHLLVLLLYKTLFSIYRIHKGDNKHQ